MAEHLDAGKKSAEEIQEEKQIRSREGEGKWEKKAIDGNFISRGQKMFTISKNTKFCCT